MATRKPTQRSKAAKAAEPARATKPVKPAKTAKTAAGSGSPRGRKAAPPPAMQRNASGRIDSVQAGLAGLRLRLRMSAGTAKAAGKARSDPRAERLDEVLKRLGERYRSLFR